jgi:regulator of sirC expression with transglutaminase-like and TPR domain
MSRHPFDLLMELDAADIRLDCAALHLARDVYPALSVNRYLHTLDELASEVAPRRPGLAANLRYEAMRSVLVEEHNFTGHTTRADDPDNLYLNRVLDAGIGIPISLSVVWLEVARRLKWPVSGVALPGNFVVRFDDPERFVLANPYHEGRALSIDECRTMVEVRTRRGAFSHAHLRPVDTRSILLRLLRNLRSIYLTRNDLPRLAGVLRRMHAVEPDGGVHIRDLAAVHARQGDMRRAAACLEVYLRGGPQGRDARLARSNLQQLHAALLAWN